MKPLDPRLLPHLRPARGPLVGVVVGGLASGVLMVVQAFAVVALLLAVFDGGGAALSRAAWVLGLTVGARAVASWLTDAAAAHASTRVVTELRRRVLDAAATLGPSRLGRRGRAEVAVLATKGVSAVDPYLTRYLPALVVAAVLPPLTVLAIAGQDLLSAGVVVGTLPLIPVFAVLVGLATRDRATRQWKALSVLSGHFVDVVRGLPTLVAYGRADTQAASIRRVTDRYRRTTGETLRLAFASSAVLELVATLSVALVAVVVGLRLAGGSLDLGTALVVLLLAPEAYWPLRRVGAEFHAAAEGTTTFEEVDRLLATARSAVPAPSAPAALTPNQRAALARVAGAAVAPVRPGGLRLEWVTVRYPGRTVAALDGVSLRIPGRGLTAVVGPSGCGKSTLLAALAGMRGTDAGRIVVETVDDHLVLDATLPLAEWQQLVSWVPQRPWLLGGSVRDNVRLGRPEADDAEVWAALERVGLGEVVAALPGGLDEAVGEDGSRFSAGQRARLALARVVLAGRPVVLLDEPTAHLDAETEQVVAETLRWLARSSCVVVVAHREALVELADHVVELPPPAPATPAAPATEQITSADSTHHERGLDTSRGRTRHITRAD